MHATYHSEPSPVTERGVQQAIQALHDSDPEHEWDRMDRHPTELAITLRALAEHLPPAPATILDCGGGPGPYAVELARRVTWPCSAAQRD
jgi:hypothetical protein